MHYQIKERERALEISKSRELFYWIGAFYNVSFIGLLYRLVCYTGTKIYISFHLASTISIDFFLKIFRYKVTKRTTNLMAVVPLTFVLAYYADLAYGSKLYRIKGLFIYFIILLNILLVWTTDLFPFWIEFLFLAEADMIMQNESDLLAWPMGLPTVSSIDQARVNTEMEKKLHPSTS